MTLKKRTDFFPWIFHEISVIFFNSDQNMIESLRKFQKEMYDAYIYFALEIIVPKIDKCKSKKYSVP